MNTLEKIGLKEKTRYKNLFAIQFLLLSVSIIYLYYNITLWVILEIILLIISISLTCLIFFFKTKNSRAIAFNSSLVLYIIAAILAAIDLQ